MAISEARRLLPRLVREVAQDGGRIDITLRGEALASLVRSADLPRRGAAPRRAAGRLNPALRVQFNFDPADLVAVIRDLRGRVGGVRSFPSGTAPRARTRTRRKKA